MARISGVEPIAGLGRTVEVSAAPGGDWSAARTGVAGALATLVLAPDPAAVRQARAFVQARCQAAGVDQNACDTAVLLTSETVTNAFVHGRSEARLALTIAAACVMVEVGDDNARHPQAAEQDPDALDGRGLAVVDRLAAGWGVRDDRYGKVVWFVVPAVPVAPAVASVPAVRRPAGCGSSTATGRTGKRSERLAALTEELRRHAPAPVSGPCLARLLGVNERTVERDIAALRESGLPLHSAVGRYGGHALLAPFGGPPLPPPTSVIM